MKVTRTYLAVPAHQDRLVASAARSEADAVFLDLEDAVPESMKAAALTAAIEALNGLDWGDKVVVVRVNGAGERQRKEIQALVERCGRLNAVLLPKVESAQEIAQVQGQLDGTRIGIEAMIETAKGLVFCEQIAAAGGNLEALHFGVGDFGASIGAKGVEIGLSHPGYAMTAHATEGYADTPLDMWACPMMRILVAARAFGLRAIDGPCGAFRDARLTESSALKAAALGYDGKQVIHPMQLDSTNRAFTPTDDEFQAAQRVVAALADAEREGRGAVQLDGKLVDYANIRMAMKVVGMRGRAGA